MGTGIRSVAYLAFARNWSGGMKGLRMATTKKRERWGAQLSQVCPPPSTSQRQQRAAGAPCFDAAACFNRAWSVCTSSAATSYFVTCGRRHDSP
jgi:hypothetical protein